MRIEGERLRRLREEAALSLRELAERAGVNWVTLWRMERDAFATVRPATLRKIAGALGVKPADLLTWDDLEKDIAA